MIADTFDKTTQEILMELEKTQKQFWNISRPTAEFLYNLIVDSKAQSVIEVGTSNGYSGIWIGKALKKTGGKLTTIEFYDKRLDIAKENFEKCGVSDVIETKKGDGATGLSGFKSGRGVTVSLTTVLPCGSVEKSHRACST